MGPPKNETIHPRTALHASLQSPEKITPGKLRTQMGVTSSSAMGLGEEEAFWVGVVVSIALGFPLAAIQE